MFKIIPLLILCAGTSLAATQTNRFTTAVEGAPINGDVLTNVPSRGDNEFWVKDFGAVTDGVTDDTAAIQGAINAALTAGGGTVYFKAGTNIFTTLSIGTIAGMPSRSVTLRLKGPLIPAQAMSITEDGGTITGGAILKSSTVGSAGQAYITAAPSSAFNAVTLDIENITLTVPPDPVMMGINARYAYALRTRGVRVWTGVAPFMITSAPTHNQAIGIATPFNNNAAFTYLQHTDVCGWWVGYEFSEHANVDYCTAWACIEGGTFPGSYHSIYMGRLGLYHCQYGLGFTGVQSRVKIDQLDIEHVSSTWQATVADIYDPSNLGSGDIDWSVILGFSGVSHTFTVTGGTGLRLREIGAPIGGGSVTNITNVTNVVTGSSALFSGSGAPSLTPTNAVALYINTNTAALYYWYGAAWH